MFELPTTWFVGTAFVEAIFGFGSSQTINIVTGLYVIMGRPFKVEDYVRIDDVEDQVMKTFKKAVCKGITHEEI